MIAQPNSNLGQILLGHMDLGNCTMGKNLIIIITFIASLHSEIPERRIVAEWEPTLGTMIRWPLGIPSDLVIELASEDLLYVLVETNYQQNQATNSFNDWDINLDNVVFINTDTYSHWTRDYGPQFTIGEDYWRVINQQFEGYPVEFGCESECDDIMVLFDCIGTEFCNNQPLYEGYDCYVNNDSCEDFNDDGQIIDWLGDGYCDDGSWGLDFMCDEYSWDCGDCGGEINDENGYCDDDLMIGVRNQIEGRPLPSQSRGWEEDDDTNIDFANQLNWDILDIPVFWTGGNFMTDGYGMGFSTRLMVNENNIDESEFVDIINEYLNIDNYHIFDNPNESSIQHMDCLAKLVNPETIIIKQVPESSPEYECMEDFAESFYELNTFYNRDFKIYRILCPDINGGGWETNPVAAYTNSLILNNKVLVPQYGISDDVQALEVYQEAMPGYQVLGFDGAANGPWYSEDALHCRVMGVFDPDMIHISHRSIRTEELPNNDNIVLIAEVIDYGNFNSDLESVVVHWKYSAEDGPFSEFTLALESDNIYTGTVPPLNSNVEIEYFITATNISSNSVSHPNAGWHTFNTLEVQVGELIIEYNSGWNLVGLPFAVENAIYTLLFPESIEGTLYSFNGGYHTEISLTNGEGYWLRFNDAGSTTISGIPINELTISLNEGWNLLSGLHEEISVYSIVDPDNIIVPNTIYGYANGYSESEILAPGAGYWIKSIGDGIIHLSFDEQIEYYCSDEESCMLTQEYCEIFYPGVPGPDVEYSCEDIPEECFPNPDCECILSMIELGDSADCYLNDEGGFIISIYAP